MFIIQCEPDIINYSVQQYKSSHFFESGRPYIWTHFQIFSKQVLQTPCHFPLEGHQWNKLCSASYNIKIWTYYSLIIMMLDMILNNWWNSTKTSKNLFWNCWFLVFIWICVLQVLCNHSNILFGSALMPLILYPSTGFPEGTLLDGILEL